MTGSSAKVKQGRPRMEQLNDSLASQKQSDSDLIQMIGAERDRDAFTELFRRYEKFGYQVAKHITFDHHLAEEALLDAMHRIWRSAPSFNPDGNARGWIIRIVARSSLKGLKGRSRRARKKAEDVEKMGELEVPEKPSSIETNELVLGLKSSLRDLSPVDRNIIALRFVGGLSQTEIGKELSMSQRTVSERIRLSLERLRKSLNNAGLAAAIPLLSADGISQAICEGSFKSSGRLDEALNRMLDSSGPLTIYRTAGICFVLMLVATAIAGMAWQMGSFSTGFKETSTSETKGEPSDLAERLNTSFARQWNFNEPDLEGLEGITGDWTHLPSGGPDGSGCMKISSEILGFGFAVSQSDLPLEMRFKVKMRRPNFSPKLFFWGDYLPESIIQNCISKHALVNHWLDLRISITTDGVGVWLKNSLLLYAMSTHRKDDRLNVRFLKGWEVDDLELHSVSKNSLPDMTKFIAAVDAIPREKRQRFHLLPSLLQPKASRDFAALFTVVFRDNQSPIEWESQTQIWRFQNSGELRDFAVVDGSWRFVPGGGQEGTGCVEMAPGEFRAFFDCRNRSTPFVIKARFKGDSKGRQFNFPTFNWYNFRARNEFKFMPLSNLNPNETVDLRNSWITMRFYVTKQYIDIWVENQRVGFQIKKNMKFGLPNLYSKDRARMDYLEVKQLPVNKIPKLGRLRAEVDRTFAKQKALTPRTTLAPPEH